MTKSVRYQKGNCIQNMVRGSCVTANDAGSTTVRSKTSGEVNAWAVCRITRRNRRLNRCELPSCRR